MRISSIRGRLLAAAALWLTLALLGAWWAIGGVLAGFVTDRFDAEAAAIADTVIGGTDAATLRVTRPPTDPRLLMPLSPWAWQLEGETGAALDRSPSLLDLRLVAPQGSFTGGAGSGLDGEPLRVLRRVFTLPGVDAPLAVTVTAPQEEIAEALARVRQPLALALVILGTGLAAATLAQVGWGLRTLDALGRDIRAIRAGQAQRVALPPVAELRPVAAELNALLDENRSVIGRARDHLGNLAHSLRTPMAALANALPADHPGQALVARMDRQIGWHLRRARSAGAPRLLGHATPVAAVIDDLLLVLRRPAAERGLAISVDCPPGARFAGERQDLEEMLGNLLENAVKYAGTRIEVTVSIHPGGRDRARGAPALPRSLPPARPAATAAAAIPPAGPGDAAGAVPSDPGPRPGQASVRPRAGGSLTPGRASVLAGAGGPALTDPSAPTVASRAADPALLRSGAAPAAALSPPAEGAAQGPRLVVTVADDGPGMADADHGRALTRGGRLDEMGPPGAGLGLAIVADLAALHGGGLTLGRAAMGGLAAQLTLPG